MRKSQRLKRNKVRSLANVEEVGVVKRGKLKVWTGAVPAIPIEAAVEIARHYTR